ncbi:hypothetical protein LOY34_14615 [Pseudomonas sp. B21-009]|uniref:hypothetical protein n=1 Tax=Pseudomonas sp. B21-009 TaxID=2895470 RepID=UPI00215F24A0|nr:hypothetical protein [Pseudomonas sp. B21-009]UVM64583.1 hypothetical protein LOY34_14615 [Pseudomonas sp. B21-009]
MNSLSTSTVLPEPAKVLDFNAFALQRLKARVVAGEVVELPANSPLCTAAEADEGLAVVDLGWVGRTMAGLPMWVQDIVCEVATEMANTSTSGPTPQNIIHRVSELLKEADEVGDLARWMRDEHGFVQ